MRRRKHRHRRSTLHGDDGYYPDGETFGDEVYVTEHETHSRLLGPDGHPLPYDTPTIGFDLRKRGE